MNDVAIFRLQAADAAELAALLQGQRPAYGQYFIPFSFAAEDLAGRLQAANEDRYWGIRFGAELAGFFMLRGFDEGYTRPSFGVFIGEEFARHGLGKLALYYALSWCRLNGTQAVMLKVHPDNTHARRIYEEAGFRFLEVCPRTGHDTLELRWQ